MTEIPKPDLELVFEHYGAQILGRDSGGWQKAECPLLDHDDKNPSASVNREECRWHCWTCDKSGDAVDLVMANEQLGFTDAIAWTETSFGSGDGPVSRERGSSGLLPRATGHKPRGGTFTAPWTRL